MKNTILLIFGLIIMNVCLYGQTETKSMSLAENITITATIQDFDASKHKIDSCCDHIVYGIDGEPIYGTDGAIPRKQLTKLIITIDDVDIHLNTKWMYEPNWDYFVRSHSSNFRVRQYYSGYTLTGMFSDGGGGYTVKWRIIENKSYRTSIVGVEY